MMCSEKHRYETREQATDSASLINASIRESKRPPRIRGRERPRRPPETKTMRAYACRHCNGWHLTSQRDAA